MATVIDAIIRLKDQLSPTLKQSQAALENFSNNSKKATAGLRQIHTGFNTVNSAIKPFVLGTVGAAVVCVKQFGNIDKAFSQLKIRLGSKATADGLVELKNQAIQLSSISEITQEQVLGVQTALAAAGESQKGILAMTPAILNGQQATGAEAAYIASMLTDVMASMHIGLKDSSLLMDQLVVAANSADLNIEDLGESLKYCAGTASTMGVNTKELLVALDTLGDNGLKGSIAGTALNNAMLRMANPKVLNSLKAMGIQVQDVQGKFVGLKNVIDQYREATSGMDSVTKAGITNQLFGEQGGRAILGLLNATTDKVNGYTTALDNAKGAAERAAIINNASLIPQLKILRNNFVNLASSFGEILAPTIKDFNLALVNLLQFINNLSPEAKQAIVQIVKLAVGFASLSLGANFLIGRFIKITTLAAKFNTAMRASGGAAGIFSNALLSTSKSLSILKESAIHLKLDKAFKLASASAKGLLNITLAPMKALAISIMHPIRALTNLSGAFKSTFGIIASTLKQIGNPINLIKNGFLLIGRVGISSIKNIVMGIFNIGKAFRYLRLLMAANPIGVLLFVLSSIILLVITHWDLFKKKALEVWNSISNTVGGAISRIRKKIDPLIKKVIQIWNTLSNFWVHVVGDSKSGSDGLSYVLNFLMNTFKVVFNLIVVVVETSINLVIDVLGILINVLGGIITFITGVFSGNWAQAWDGIKQIFSGIFNGIGDICHDVMDGIKSYINEVIKGINGLQFKMPDWLPSWLGGGKQFGPLNIPLLFTGTENWPGGLAQVHDQGGEIIDLPSGSRVLPHDKSIQEAYNMGKINTGKRENVTNITIAKLAECIQVKEKADVEEIARTLAFKLKSYGINQLEGAV